MNKPRKAKLIKVEQAKYPHEHPGTPPTWVATDSDGRRFWGSTQAEAVVMLEKYNSPPQELRKPS